MNIPRRPSPNLHALDPIRERGGKNRTDKTRSKGPISPRMRRSVAPYAAAVDSELVQQAIASDPVAQERLYRMCTPKLYRAAFAVLRNKEDAEDAVQDTWFRAYNQLKSFQGRSSFTTWLTRIAINSALMIFRKNQNVRAVSIEELEAVDKAGSAFSDASPTPEQIYAQAERRTLLHEAICALRPRLRCVMELKQLRELSLNEAVRELGISLGAVKTRYFHAQAALRKSPTLKGIVRGKNELAA